MAVVMDPQMPTGTEVALYETYAQRVRASTSCRMPASMFPRSRLLAPTCTSSSASKDA